jgi:hypothetical protein
MSAHYDTEHCTVTYDAGKRTVILAWKKFAKGDDFKNALEAGLELVKKKGAKRWVGDCQNLGPIAPADQKWVNEDWFPRLLGTGMQRMAVIIPKSALSKMAVDQIMTKVEGTDFVSCNFGDFDEGASWVTERKAA